MRDASAGSGRGVSGQVAAFEVETIADVQDAAAVAAAGLGAAVATADREVGQTRLLAIERRKAELEISEAPFIGVFTVDYLRALDGIIADTDLDTWKTYLTWSALNQTAGRLTKAIDQQNFQVYERTPAGGGEAGAMLPRSQAPPPGVLRFRSTMKRTVSAVMGSPSSKVTPSRTLMVYVSPSEWASHDSK